MKKLILLAALVALTPTLAFSAGIGGSNGGGDCNALRNSAEAGAGAQCN